MHLFHFKKRFLSWEAYDILWKHNKVEPVMGRGNELYKSGDKMPGMFELMLDF